MHRRVRSILFVLIFSALRLVAVGRDMAKEAEIEASLAKLDATLVEPFRAARIAMDEDKYADSARLLRTVVDRLPSFDPALRRLGASLEQTGKHADAIAWCEKAVAANRSVANLITLAHTLAFPHGGSSSQSERVRALALFKECREHADGNGADVVLTTIHLHLLMGSWTQARVLLAEAEQRFPNEMGTHYFAAVLAANEEQWNRAVREIRAAEKLGLAAKTVEEFLSSGVQSSATTWAVIGTIVWAVGLWAAGLIALFGLGILLSKTTLRQADRADLAQAVNPGEQRLRRLYRHVLNIAGVYYYISLPIVLILVVAVGGGLIYGFFAIGRIPIQLTIMLVVGVFATIWSMGRSLFLRAKSEDPGRALERHEAEDLWRLTDEVARTMNTRPIDEIRLTIGTELAVYERGTWREKMDNRAQRVLILGAAVLHGFKQDDFRSVLAHEYGHFANRDTAGGDVAMRVQNDMLKFYFAMREAGQATWLNVAFHFLRMYHFIFRRISHGATRLQEILADRVAAQHYGPAAFEGGLRHVIRRSIAFESHANREIEDAIKTRRPLQNLYEGASADAQGVHDEFEKAINRPTTEDDTHPGPMDRFRLIAKIPAPTRPPAPGEVWDLFKDREAVIKEMTAKIEANIAAHRS